MFVDMGLDARERGVMANGAKETIALTTAEVSLLAEALDSHEYWQLSDPTWRSSGYVILPGEDIEVSTVAPLDGASEKRLARSEARRLQDLLRAATS